MAIKLDKENREGFTGNHWFLSSLTIEADVVKGIFRLYKSKQDRNAGKTALRDVATASVPLANPGMNYAQMRAALHTAVVRAAANANEKDGDLVGGEDEADD